MDTAGIAVQLSVLKKAMDINAHNGLQLIQGVAKAVPNNPPNLGNNIDITA